MKKDFFKITIPLFALLLCGVVVMLERIGVTYEMSLRTTDFQTEFTKEVEQDTECLILYDEEDKVSKQSAKMMAFVLDAMKIGYKKEDVASFSGRDELASYQSVAIALEDWTLLENHLLAISDWVYEGGKMMNTMTPSPTEAFGFMAEKMGITSFKEEYASINGFRVLNDCMLGAEETDVFPYDESGEMLYISLDIRLSEDADVYMESADGTVPLMWKMLYGEGTFVMLNETLLEKYQRGFLCTAYSLLDEATIYPVINASTYYLDDFPAPVPQGNSEYIRRDYGVDTATFYSMIWWPQMLKWEKQFGIKHTGVIIEQYNDLVEGDLVTQTETSQFSTYGNMLLNHGGELGLHGYNHMPLCIKGTDDDRQYGSYVLWPSSNNIKKAMMELESYAKSLFPGETFSVYVPPSNIISESGIKALVEACPDIKVLASSYMRDANKIVYEQEYAVDEDGLIHAPRITSGCQIDDYQKITALSELNFQYVQSHFTHPDDVLDEDRGASLGWESLRQSLESYLQWVNKSVPQIRNMTGSEMGNAVLKYTNLSVKRTRKENELQVSLGGFSDEAYLMLRLDGKKPVSTKGCEVTLLKGDLYMVHATKDEIKITLGD